MPLQPRSSLTLLIGLALLPGSGRAAVPGDRDGIAFFESKIRPVLVENCYRCHSAAEGKSEGGLVLDSAWGWQYSTNR